MSGTELLQALWLANLIAAPAVQLVENFVNAGVDPTPEQMAAAKAENEADTDALHAAGQHDRPDEEGDGQ